MKPSFLFALLPAGAAALIGWQAQRADLSGSALNPDTQHLQCPTTPTFHQAYPEPAQELPGDETGQTANLMGDGWLELDVCGPGTLQLRAEGALAENQGPRLEVALNSEPILTQEIREPQTLQVAVPRAGHLTLGYFNDFYSSEYRSVAVQQLKFSSPNCDSFKVTVPEKGGGEWNAQAGLLSFILGTEATLQPCAAGQLSLQVLGNAAAGEAPLLTFVQGGKELKRIPASPSPTEVNLSLSHEPLHIQFLNPYFKELGDRNLHLEQIKFIPESQVKK